MHQPLPLTLFTGFLGAGKTHVIQRVLHALEEEGERVLLVINDLSQDNMDAYAFHNPQQTQRAVESLSGGCVCCNLLGTHVETLVEAHRRCREDGAAAYTRVFVECTGVADPTPVAATLSSLPALDGVVEMEAVIAVVNARSLDADGSPLDRMAGSQLRGANIVLINQWEMVSEINPATMQQWCARLKAFGAEENPHMRVYATNSGFFAFRDLVRGAKLFEEDGSRAYFLRAYAATGKAVGDVGDAEEEAGELELLGARHFTYEASSSSSTTSLRRLRAQLTSPAGRGLFRHVWRSKGFFFAHDDEVEDGATIASKLHTRKQFRWQSVNRSVDYGEVLPPYVELRTPKDGLLDARIVFIGGFDAHKEEQVRAFFAEAQAVDASMADFEEERLLPCLVDILTISPNLTYADAVQRAKTMLSGDDGGGSGAASTCAHHVPVAACNDDDDDETTQTMRLALKDAADDLMQRWTNIIRDMNSATSPHMEVVHTVDFIEGTQSSISVRAAVLAGMAVGDALGFLARGIVPLWEACTHRTLDDCLVLAYVEVFTAVLRLLGGYVDANHVWATAAESLLPSSGVEHLLCGLEVELAYHFKAGRATSKVSAPQHFFTFFLDVLDRLENGLRSEATVVQRLCFGRLGSTATAVFVEAYLWYDTSALLHNTDFVVFTINAFVDLLKSCNGRPHIHALEPLETVVAMPSAFDLYLRHGLREVASLLHSEASSSWRFQLLNENEKTLLQHPFYSMTRRFLRSLQAMLRRLFISAATMIERRGLDEAVRKTLLKPALDAYLRAAEIHEEQLMRSSNDLWFLVHALHAQLASVYAARRLMDDCVLSQRNVEQLDCPATRVRVDPYVAKLEKRLDVLLRRILSRLMQSVEEEDEESHSAGVGEWMRLEELLMSLQPKSSAAGRCLQQKLQDLIIHAIHPDTVNSMSLRGFLRAMDCPCSAELLGNLCAA